MKLEPVTEFDKKNKKKSKKVDDDVMSENCDVIIIFQIYGQSGAIRKPDSGRIVCKSYVLPKIGDFLQKNVDITKIKKAFVLKGTFSETTYVCLLTCQI